MSFVCGWMEPLHHGMEKWAIFTSRTCGVSIKLTVHGPFFGLSATLHLVHQFPLGCTASFYWVVKPKTFKSFITRFVLARDHFVIKHDICIFFCSIFFNISLAHFSFLQIIIKKRLKKDRKSVV